MVTLFRILHYIHVMPKMEIIFFRKLYYIFGPNHEYHHCWLPKLRAEGVTINPANIIKVLAIWEHPNVHLKEFPWPRNYIYFLDGKKTNAAENHTKRQKQWCKWEIHLMTQNTIKLYRQNINKARQNKQTNKQTKRINLFPHGVSDTGSTV